jgi:hypothetical protein
LAAACARASASYGSERWEGVTYPVKGFSGKQVMPPEPFKNKLVAEEKDKQEKAHPWNALNKDGGLQLCYRGRYQESLEKKLTKAVNKSDFVNVIGLMEHVLDESEPFFEDTEEEGNFFIFYGGLS